MFTRARLPRRALLKIAGMGIRSLAVSRSRLQDLGLFGPKGRLNPHRNHPSQTQTG